MTSYRLDDFLKIKGKLVKSVHISTVEKTQAVDRQAVQEIGDIVGIVHGEWLDDDLCVDRWYASVKDIYSYMAGRTFMGIKLTAVEVRCSA